jgi:antirestriction protein ArdC
MNVYDIITERILKKLEEGTVPWRKPWQGGDAGIPRNVQTGFPYRGINVFLLAAAGHASPYWLTFRQAKRRGGNVRKGEHGTPVIFWKWPDPEDGKDGGEDARAVPVLRYYLVFNVEQCDGVSIPVTSLAPQRAFSPLARCEEILERMPDAPRIEHGRTHAAYLPARDTVILPARSAFESEAAYYATLFHELAHATGHARRLARPAVMDTASFGSHAYSKEELIAEMGAAFLCGHAGIEAATLESAASYIDGWLRVLRGDGRLVVQAATHAQRAADFILGRAAESESDAGEEEPASAARPRGSRSRP